MTHRDRDDEPPVLRYRLLLECGHRIKTRRYGMRKYYSCSICKRYRLTVVEKEEL